jgi:sugar lactone lactonase YvrE
VKFSNGLAYDEVGRKLYCSDTFNVGWAWDVEADLSLNHRRIFLEKEDCDGMALDQDRNV